MTLASTIIAAAFRENNLIPIGTSPTTAEAAEGLTVLNNVVLTLFGNELGEQLRDWPIFPPQRTASVASRYPQAPQNDDLPSSVWPYPPANSRLVCTNTSAVTVYFPEAPSDGARMAYLPVGSPATVTFDGNGRYIDGAASTDSTIVTTATTWLYRADTGSWTTLATLTAGASMPLPAEFDDYFICATNIRLCPRFDKQPQPATLAILKDAKNKIAARYRQEVTWIGGGADLPLTLQTLGGSVEPTYFNPGA
jgi:hypothetical protein